MGTLRCVHLHVLYHQSKNNEMGIGLAWRAKQSKQPPRVMVRPKERQKNNDSVVQPPYIYFMFLQTRTDRQLADLVFGVNSL